MEKYLDMFVEKAVVCVMGTFSGYAITRVVNPLEQNKVLSKEAAEYLRWFLNGLVGIGLSREKEAYVISLVIGRILKHSMQLENVPQTAVVITESIVQFLGDKINTVIFDDVINAGVYVSGNKFGIWAAKPALGNANDSDNDQTHLKKAS